MGNILVKTQSTNHWLDLYVLWGMELRPSIEDLEVLYEIMDLLSTNQIIVFTVVNSNVS